MFLVYFTIPFISVVILSIVDNVALIVFLVYPVLEVLSIYNFVDVFKISWFNLNFPSPGSEEEVSPKSIWNS